MRTPDHHPEREATTLELQAHMHETHAGKLRAQAESIRIRAVLHQMDASFARADADQLASHPDLAELDLMLDGYYPERSDQ